MAMETGEIRTAEYMAGRMDELERENTQLRRDLQALRAEASVARGAAQSAMAEEQAAREVTTRLAAEGRVTQQVLAEQNSNFGFVNIMLTLIFVSLLACVLGVFAWVPNKVVTELRPRTTVVAPAPAPGTTIIR